ncbi:MAG: Hsp20 family protein [Erysipelotrichales bacterium]|nr:Hsp20 family protein [Erysipelotrichales bacterium]
MYMTRTNQLDSLFNEVFPYRERPSVQYMHTDIKKVNENYIMEIDLPGVSKESISISLEKGLLTIMVNEGNEDTEYVLRERVHGEYGRRYRVSKDLVEEDIKAAFQQGVLTLTFPVEKKVERKTITIE